MADDAPKDFTLSSDPLKQAQSGPAMAGIDFSTFVLSLATTALLQLGIVPDPSTGQPLEANPLLSRQTIETLEMLREKTRGNLSDDERELIDSLLYELRMRYVEATKPAGSRSPGR